MTMRERVHVAFNYAGILNYLDFFPSELSIQVNDNGETTKLRGGECI